MITLAQSSMYDHDLRAMAAVMAAGALLAVVVAVMRGVLSPTVYAVLTAASATLGVVYVAAGIGGLSQIFKVAMPPAGDFVGGPGRTSRAVVAAIGLGAGLALSWFALTRDVAADSPGFAETRS